MNIGYIPTYEDCKAICDANDNFLFYESVSEIDGYKISVFNYRLSQYSDFINPLKNNSGINAFELRGLTFCFNKDGSLFNRYLMLHKFFNLNQSPCSSYSELKNLKIKSVYNKEDGSIASFIRLPNGRVVGRSKSSFISEQAIEIQKIYDSNSHIKKFVNFCLDSDIIPIFEFVSPQNKIVLDYSDTKLILLRIRDNKTGIYLDISQFSDKLNSVHVAESIKDDSLDSIIEYVKNLENKEGVIIQFENDKMVKLKSPWYLNLHGLFTNELNRENHLIKMIVEEEIDDVLCQFNDAKKTEEVSKISNIVNEYIKNVSSDIDVLLSHFNNDIKEFAIKYVKNPLFPITIGVIRGGDKISLIKAKILSDTKNLLQAKDWINKNNNL